MVWFAEVSRQYALLDGLLSERYQIVITDAPVEQDDVLCREYVTEQLHISLPPAHPLAKKDSIHLSDLDGQTMLLFSDLGVWGRVCEEQMKHIRFIVQSERDAFVDLINASVLPNFVTNLTHSFAAALPDRVEVPILDPVASITFWLCALKKNRKLLERVPDVAGNR